MSFSLSCGGVGSPWAGSFLDLTTFFLLVIGSGLQSFGSFQNMPANQGPSNTPRAELSNVGTELWKRQGLCCLARTVPCVPITAKATECAAP